MTLSSFFFDMPSELMTALATVLGFTLFDDLNANQQNSLGNFLELIAQVLITNATQKQYVESQRNADAHNDYERRIQRLEQALLARDREDHPFSSSSD